MSERVFFSLRYTVPGYVFVFLVLSVNISPSLRFLENSGSPEVFGAILAFASLLGGSVAGFLVSQFWWWWFHHKGGIYGIKEFAPEIKILEDELKLNLPKDKEKKRKVVEAFLDLTSSLEKKGALRELVWRRWDLFTTLSSVRHVLWIGLGAGIAFRVFIEFRLAYYRTLLFDNPPDNPENLAFILAIVIVAGLWFFFGRVRKHLLSRYAPLHEALVRRSLSANIFELKTAFPFLFEKSKEEKNEKSNE